jgi:hypothetical protein
MPSPESPANRITTWSSSWTGLAIPGSRYSARVQALDGPRDAHAR